MATNAKVTRRNLKRTERPLVAYGRTLRGHAATRILLKALRQEFLDAGVWIRDDVKRLRKRVVCPADLGGASVFIIDLSLTTDSPGGARSTTDLINQPAVLP